MKKFIGLLVITLVLTLAGCIQAIEIQCGAGTIEQDGQCVRETIECNTGYEEVGGVCVLIEDDDTCEIGYHDEDGTCVVDEVVELPDWFADYKLLNEPVGDKTLDDLTFTETGFSVFVEVDKRVGIQQTGLTLEPGYYYEVNFDYSSDVAGKGLFVQLQGHGGYQFTNPGVITAASTQSFSQMLVMSPSSTLTNDGWFTIEITPSGVAGTVTINNIEIVKTALPTCGVNEVISGIVCIPANNGFLPNGTPTAWFDGWNILTNPSGNKDVSDYDFTETGYTVYLAEGERSGIELMNYVFESGYTYELSFDYTASVALRQIWIQMVALGGYEFTNTDTWTIDGTATFTQSLVIPSTYTPVEPGWIKLELTPGALDNITISNITITVTPN